MVCAFCWPEQLDHAGSEVHCQKHTCDGFPKTSKSPKEHERISPLRAMCVLRWTRKPELSMRHEILSAPSSKPIMTSVVSRLALFPALLLQSMLAGELAWPDL